MQFCRPHSAGRCIRLGRDRRIRDQWGYAPLYARHAATRRRSGTVRVVLIADSAVRSNAEQALEFGGLPHLVIHPYSHYDS